MPETVLYLSRSEIDALQLDPVIARHRVTAAFKAHATDRSASRPKLSLDIGPGHAFQSLCAASAEIGMAATKWLGMARSPDGGGANIDALMALNDFASGRLLAILDGNGLTGLRTAAMSAAAAASLARPDSAVIGFVGCGLQARAHLHAMKALLPGLSRVLAFGKGRASTERFATYARGNGFAVETIADASDVVRASDILVTSVPMRSGFRPFLDAAWLPEGSFVSAVDIARSWIPESLDKLDLLATDDHRQQAEHPPIFGTLGALGSFHADLSELSAASGPLRSRPDQRAMFIFRGFALADLAVAAYAFQAAVAQQKGMILPR